MKFTIEVEDFWLDSEDQLEPALAKHIISEVTRDIKKLIEKKVDDQIIRELKKEFEIGYSKKIREYISDSFENGDLKIGQGDNKTSAKEYFLQNASAFGYNTVRDTLATLAKKHADEIKKRYDLQYAAHVVSKLSDNGLLKDEEIKKLLQ